MTQTVYLKLSQITQVHEKMYRLQVWEKFIAVKKRGKPLPCDDREEDPRRRETARKPSGWKRHGDYPAD